MIKKLEIARCLSTDEWLNNVCYIQSAEYYSAVKRNELLTPTNIWMHLQRTVLSENIQSQRVTYCKTLFILHFCNEKILDVENIVVSGIRNENKRGIQKGTGCDYKRATQEVLWWWNCQYLDRIVDTWT